MQNITGKACEQAVYDEYFEFNPLEHSIDFKRYRIRLAREWKDFYCSSDFKACQYALAYAGCPQPVTLDRVTVDGENMLYRIFSIEDGE